MSPVFESMPAVTKFTGKFGLRHVQILLMLMTHIIAYTMHSCMSVAMVAMTDTKANRSDVPILDWPVHKRSLILSSDLWGSLVAQIPFGFIVLKYNSQKIMAGAMLICSLMYFLIPTLAVKVGWSAVLCSTVVVGLGLGAIEPAQQSLFSRWVPPGERARLVSIVMSGGNLGVVFSMSVSGLLAGSSYGWPSLFYAFGGISAASSLLFFFLAANSPSQHPWISPEERNYIESSLGVAKQKRETKHLKFPLKSVVTCVPVWAYLICICCQVWCINVWMTQLPIFIKNALHYEISKTGSLAALPFIAKILFAPIIGWFSDLALRRGTHISTVRKVANTIGMWGPAASVLVLCLIQPSDRRVVIIILVITLGLNGGIFCAVFINALDLTPNFSGTVYSIANTIAKLFALVAPIVCGAIVGEEKASIERWHIVFYISVATFFFGNLIFILFGSAEKQSWNNLKLTDENTSELSSLQKCRDDEFE